MACRPAEPQRGRPEQRVAPRAAPVAALPAPGADARAAAKPGASDAQRSGPTPFRSALNDFEADALDESDIVDLKRRLGMQGAGSRSATLDQAARDAIRSAQERMGWPATGELSARFVQALREGQLREPVL